MSMDTFCLMFTVMGVPTVGWLWLKWRHERGRADRQQYIADCRATVIEQQGEKLKQLHARATRAETDSDMLAACVLQTITTVDECATLLKDEKPPPMKQEREALRSWKTGRELRRRSPEKIEGTNPTMSVFDEIPPSPYEPRSTPKNADGDSQS